MTILKLKRAYAPQSPDDGYRIYIDRLWPQGLSHLTFHYDEWDKEIAPGKELRQRFHADRDANWRDFEKEYTAQLLANPAWLQFVKDIETHKTVTLLYSSKNETENNAVIVYNLLLKQYPEKFKA